MIAVIFERFGPYHDARLTAANEHIPGGVVAIEMFARDVTYQWDILSRAPHYRRATVISDATPDLVSPRRLWAGIQEVLDDIRPDAVAIPGWQHPGAIAALHWARRRDVPSVLMAESTEMDRRRFRFVECLKSKIVSLYDAALVGGTKHKEYTHRLGMPEGKVFLGYDVVDNKHFSRRALECRRTPSLRSESFALPEQYFLCSARFIPVKNLLMLLNAFRCYRRVAREAPWDLVILGDGPERAAIEQKIDVLGLSASVRLAGFRQYDELPRFYAFAGAFVLPSISEPWGLVINEAMASGLPVLASSRCGCVPDLAEHMKTGLVFDPSKPDELCEAMRAISTDEKLHTRLAIGAEERVKDWGLERFSDGLRRSIDAAASSGGKMRSHHRLVISMLPLLARVRG